MQTFKLSCRRAEHWHRSVVGLTVIVHFFCLLSAGCSSSRFLPVAKVRVESPWESFDQAKQAFDKIVPFQTSEQELQSLNFAPFNNPNIEIVDYLALVNRFMPTSSVRKEDLPNGIQQCIENTNQCYGYELKLNKIQNMRFGNVFLDMLKFKRQSHKTGWEFNALIVIKNDLVVYKLWSGKPKIDEFSYSKNPLGPLQEPETVISTVGVPLL